MEKSDAAGKIFELTDIIEEGLPLDQLPETGSWKNLRAEAGSGNDSLSPAVAEPEAEAVALNDDDSLDLDLDNFSDLDMLEPVDAGDPVLAELKHAGLREQVETLSYDNKIGGEREMGKPGLCESSDDLFDDDFDDLDDFDDILNETEVKSSPEPVPRSKPEPEIELPEDYLVDDELLAEDVAADITPGPPPETHARVRPDSGSPASPLRPDPEAPVATPHIFTEPQSLDFSQQIEDMTQEWSKQLLQTTYASMDKMIKAIGDLAPTIVDQVAREVIPPLAEKVIKAEIARMEEKLELEEGKEE